MRGNRLTIRADMIDEGKKERGETESGRPAQYLESEMKRVYVPGFFDRHRNDGNKIGCERAGEDAGHGEQEGVACQGQKTPRLSGFESHIEPVNQSRNAAAGAPQGNGRAGEEGDVELDGLLGNETMKVLAEDGDGAPRQIGRERMKHLCDRGAIGKEAVQGNDRGDCGEERQQDEKGNSRRNGEDTVLPELVPDTRGITAEQLPVPTPPSGGGLFCWPR